MNWYYAKDGKRQGPVDEVEFELLVNEGTIAPDTLVWSKGMDGWKEYSEVKAPKEAAPSGTPSESKVEEPAGPTARDEWYYVSQGLKKGPVSDREFQAMVAAGKIKAGDLVWRPGMSQWQAYGVLAGTASKDDVFCAECGCPFPADETINYQGEFVCAQCKNIFFQRLREGADRPGILKYGGFWIRVAAKLLDNILLGFVNFLLQMPFSIAQTSFSSGLENGPAPFPILLFMISFLLQIAVPAAYTTFFLGKYAATPGKMACGLIVLRPDGIRITYWRALGRHFAEMLSQITCFIGYIIAAFDDEKRTLHDHICDTRVFYKK